MLCRKYFPVLKKQIVKMVCFFSFIIKIGSLLTYLVLPLYEGSFSDSRFPTNFT